MLDMNVDRWTHSDPRANKLAIATYSLLDRSLRQIIQTGMIRTAISKTMLSAEWLSYVTTKGARSLVPATISTFVLAGEGRRISHHRHNKSH